MTAGDLGDRVAIGACIAAALYMLLTPWDAQSKEPALSDPICPSGVWVAQRYDKRDKAGRIIKSTWRRVCYSKPLVIREGKIR